MKTIINTSTQNIEVFVPIRNLEEALNIFQKLKDEDADVFESIGKSKLLLEESSRWRLLEKEKRVNFIKIKQTLNVLRYSDSSSVCNTSHSIMSLSKREPTEIKKCLTLKGENIAQFVRHNKEVTDYKKIMLPDMKILGDVIPCYYELIVQRIPLHLIESYRRYTEHRKDYIAFRLAIQDYNNDCDEIERVSYNQSGNSFIRNELLVRAIDSVKFRETFEGEDFWRDYYSISKFNQQ